MDEPTGTSASGKAADVRDGAARRWVSGTDPTATARAVMEVRMKARAGLRVGALLMGAMALTSAGLVYPSYSLDLSRATAGLAGPVIWADYFYWPMVLASFSVMATMADLVGLRWIVPVPGLRCPKCGYDVRGHTRGPCPECGLPLGELAPSAVTEL